MKEALKIGILLNSEIVPLWVHNLILRLDKSGYSEIKLVMYKDPGETVKGRHDSFAYHLHEKLDRLTFRPGIEFGQLVNSSDLLKGFPTIIIHSNAKKTPAEFSGIDLDLVLNLSSNEISDSDIKQVRYGIWQYAANGRSIFNTSSVYWQMVKQTPVIETSIQCFNGSVDKKILHQSWLPTNFNSLIYNYNYVCEHGILHISNLIRNLWLNGDDFLTGLKLKHKINIHPGAKISIPKITNQVAIKNLFVVLIRAIFRKTIYSEKFTWILILKFGPLQLPIQSGYDKIIYSPEGRFWADPFVLIRNDKIFIFVEDYYFNVSKANISILELDKEGNLLYCKNILEKPYHLSYPFVFEVDDTLYMVPETSENKTIELYKCDSFPDRWSFVMNLMENVVALDTTLFFHNHKWWLFTSINEMDYTLDHNELNLFYSDNLFTTNWTPHPCNPVVSDVRHSRPAGRIFIHDNKILRPSQDCSGRYGKAFNLNQITTLSETEYAEIVISKTEANWMPGLQGTHTYNFDKSVTVIDAYRYFKRFM
jgi:hypothetical protein